MAVSTSLLSTPNSAASRPKNLSFPSWETSKEPNQLGRDSYSGKCTRAAYTSDGGTKNRQIAGVDKRCGPHLVKQQIRLTEASRDHLHRTKYG